MAPTARSSSDKQVGTFLAVRTGDNGPAPIEQEQPALGGGHLESLVEFPVKDCAL